MESKTYRVRLVRPVFQAVIVEVEASCEDEAVVEAIVQADTVPEQEWVGAFDPGSYFYDVHYVEEAADAEEDYIRVGIEDDRKYLLLRGDVDSGTGAMPFQPWLAEVSDLVVADLCSDWSDDLAALEQKGIFEYFGSMDLQAKEKNKTLAKVIPFRRPGSPSDEK